MRHRLATVGLGLTQLDAKPEKAEWWDDTNCETDAPRGAEVVLRCC